MNETKSPRPLGLSLCAMLGVLLASAALSGCLEPSAEATKPTDAQALVDAMVYVKAKNGLCFGIATTSRMSTNVSIAYSNVAVVVPCGAVGL